MMMFITTDAGDSHARLQIDERIAEGERHVAVIECLMVTVMLLFIEEGNRAPTLKFEASESIPSI